MQCLLELLRGRSFDRATGEWDAALTLAEEEHVAPWAAACLRSRPSLTPTIANRLDQIERDAAIAAFYWSSALKGVLRAFLPAQIMAIPLKGPFLAERLYGATSLRVCRDLDLLVSKEDLARAEGVLTAIGFVPGDADDYHCPWYRETTTVELHHDVENPLAFDFDVESALLRVRPAIFQGECCGQLAPEDELLFLCLHAARHRFERLSLILDLELAFRKMADVWQPRSEVAELSSLLTLGLAMARRLQPDIRITADFHVSERQAAHLEMVADRLWQRLLLQSGEALDWRSVHSFFIEIDRPGWPRLHRRYRHLQIFLSRVIAPDYTFAARFGLHRTWQARMLRPLRLLSESMRPLRRKGRRA